MLLIPDCIDQNVNKKLHHKICTLEEQTHSGAI